MLGLASSTPNYLLIHILEIFGIIDYFDAVVGGDEVEYGKPHPEIFLRTFSKLGVNPNEGAVVGDTLYDVIPANKIGAFSIHLQRNNNKEIEVSAHMQKYALPKFKIKTLCDFLVIIKRSL